MKTTVQMWQDYAEHALQTKLGRAYKVYVMETNGITDDWHVTIGTNSVQLLLFDKRSKDLDERIRASFVTARVLQHKGQQIKGAQFLTPWTWHAES